MIIKLCYYNGHWNVYIYTKGGYESWIKNPDQIIKKGEYGEFRFRTYNYDEIPIHGFGFMHDDPQRRPGHGGEWSSNSESINPIFGVDVMEVAVDQIGVAVPRKWLKEQLGGNVTWEVLSCYGEVITDIPGKANNRKDWVELVNTNFLKTIGDTNTTALSAAY